jgi:acyl dehydratase
MAEQVYFEDVKEGAELPTLVKHPTPQQLVKWAAASGDFYEIHYNKDFALSTGLPGIIVHGDLSTSFLVQLITDWVGELGTFKKISTQYRALTFPDEDLLCKGVVTKKYTEANEHYVECDVWAENPRGQKCTLGTALAILPTRPG